MMTTFSNQSIAHEVGGLMGMPTMSDPHKMNQGKSDSLGSPMSQATTAPSSPYFCASLPDPFGNELDSDGWSRQSSPWSRQISPVVDDPSEASTCVAPNLGTRSRAATCFLDAIAEELEEVKAIAAEKEKLERAEDSDDDDSIEWLTEGNTQSAQHQESDVAHTMAAGHGSISLRILEEKFDEVEHLFKAKYGRDWHDVDSLVGS